MGATVESVAGADASPMQPGNTASVRSIDATAGVLVLYISAASGVSRGTV
jgi:hypothetical protein